MTANKPKIHVSCHARSEIQAVALTAPNARVISISTPGTQALWTDHAKHVLSLHFDDLDRIPSAGTILALGKVVLFNEEHARQIGDFVNGGIDIGITRYLVHCDAGVSRSPGVAAALAKYYNKDDIWFFIYKRPNMHVYGLLLQILLEM